MPFGYMNALIISVTGDEESARLAKEYLSEVDPDTWSDQIDKQLEARNVAGLSTGLRELSTDPENVRLITKAATRRGWISKCRWLSVKCSYSNNERQQMTNIEHSLKFVTELDETNPTAQRLLSMPEPMQIAMLEGMLKEMILPAIQPVIDEINENGSWAILKVAN